MIVAPCLKMKLFPMTMILLPSLVQTGSDQ